MLLRDVKKREKDCQAKKMKNVVDFDKRLSEAHAKSTEFTNAIGFGGFFAPMHEEITNTKAYNELTANSLRILIYCYQKIKKKTHGKTTYYFNPIELSYQKFKKIKSRTTFKRSIKQLCDLGFLESISRDVYNLSRQFIEY